VVFPSVPSACAPAAMGQGSCCQGCLPSLCGGPARRPADRRCGTRELKIASVEAAKGAGATVEALRALAAEDYVPAISEVVCKRGEVAVGSVLLRFPGAASDSEAGALGTAARLWEPGVVLAARLCAEPASELRGASVLELGAGLGFVGLHLASLGARVTLTDLPAAETLLKRSVAANAGAVDRAGGAASFRVLDWAEVNDDVMRDNDFDCLVAADPVFDEATARHFVGCLARLLASAKRAGRHPLDARVAHKHRPGVCCEEGIWGVRHAREPGGCSLAARLRASGLRVEEEEAVATTDPLAYHPFVAVWRVTAAAYGS